MDSEYTIEEEVQEISSAKDVWVKTSKGKFVSQDQFEDLISTVARIQMSFSNETTEGQFVLLPTTAEQQNAKLCFVEGKAMDSPISEDYAKYEEDCCRKHILSSEITKLRSMDLL